MDKIRPLLIYYKKNILPDEPLNASTFAFVEKRLLERVRQYELESYRIAASPKTVSAPVDVVQEQKERNEGRGIQERKENRDKQDRKETKEHQETKDVHEQKEHKEALERILTHYQEHKLGKTSKENRLSEKLKNKSAPAPLML